MEQKKERTLPFLVEVLIIAAVTILLNFALSPLFSSLITGSTSQSAVALTYLILLVRYVLIPMLATVLCAKVIETRKVGVVKLLLAALLVCLTIVITWMVMYGTLAYYLSFEANMVLNKIQTIQLPVILSLYLALFIRMLSVLPVQANPFDENMHCPISRHVVYLLFSFGIWPLMWIYRATTYLNSAEDEPRRGPAAQLLLCMFVPFYQIYWMYQSARRVDKLAASVHVASDLAVLCLILTIFIPIVPPILMQDKINRIIAAKPEV